MSKTPLEEVLDFMVQVTDEQNIVNSSTLKGLDHTLNILSILLADQQLMEARLQLLEAETHDGS